MYICVGFFWEGGFQGILFTFLFAVYQNHQTNEQTTIYSLMIEVSYLLPECCVIYTLCYQVVWDNIVLTVSSIYLFNRTFSKALFGPQN